MENLLDIHGAREPLKNWSDNSSKFDDMVTGVSYNIKKRRNLKKWHKYVYIIQLRQEQFKKICLE
jgi:hypothetical protein